MVTRASVVPMGVVLAGGLVARGLWAVWRTGAIESEGAEYARIAQNLRNGVGYVGIATPGPEIMFPPLYPFLIAAVSFLTGDYELAARLISVCAGAALPLAVFGIASRLFGRSTAIVAAVLAGGHPFLVTLSATAYSETLYLTLFLGGVYLVLRGLDQPSPRVWALAGGLFGLAYLTRPEALVTLAIAVMLRVIAPGGPLRRRIAWGLSAVAVFLLLVSPYVLFLYRATGQLRLEGKSAVHLAFGKRIVAGQSVDEAQYSIDERLEGTGVWMRPVIELFHETRLEPATIAVVTVKAARRNAPLMLSYLSSPWMGGPILFGLAVLGFFRRPWRRGTALAHLTVTLVAVGCLIGPLSVHFPDVRFAFVLIPFVVLWGSAGLVQVFRWTRATAAVIVPTEPARRLGGVALAGILAAAPLTVSFRNVSDLFRQGGSESRVVEDVAAWIRRQQDRPVTIMDFSTQIAFHAGAQWIHFPYTDGERALRFLDRARVDYVILRWRDQPWDYYREWREHGIPDARAELVYVSSDPHFVGDLKVFRWRRPQGGN